MTKLNKYTKTDARDLVVTSVNLEQRHMEFVRRLRLNVSKLIRDYIDELIKEENAK